MKSKFDLVYEEILKDIEDSYVDYELFDDFKTRITDELKQMSREDAEKYIKKLNGKYWNEPDKKEVLPQIFNEVFGETK